MEELFAYALLYCEGFDAWPLYSNALDKLFIENPENEEYLSLEYMMPKEAVLHSIAVMHRGMFNSEYFGKALMNSLQQIYENVSIEVFARKTYSLWTKIPWFVAETEPYFIFSYADECLTFNDEQQCRKLYEQALHYYD